MDRGLWVTWYDLPEDGRDAYLLWLHETFIPKMAARPGILFGCHYGEVPAAKASVKHTDDPEVPTGSNYMLIFGAEEADVFGDPLPSQIHDELPEADKKMLASRIGARTSILAEFGRVQGPEAKTYKDGVMLANCIQLGTYNTEWQNEEELLAYYTQARLLHMKVMPGCVRTRKLVSVAGWAKHGVLYEFTSLEMRNKHFVGHGDDKMKAWSKTMVPRLNHAPGSANLAVRLWPPASA